MKGYQGSDYAQRFVSYLDALKEHDRAALARLRHSLAFKPGTYTPVFPYVERFVADNVHEYDARRIALYVVAGLFARHPSLGQMSFAEAFGELFRTRNNESLEKRFITILSADANNIHEYLRQAISLLAADRISVNYSGLLDDLVIWLNPWIEAERLDRLRQRWARAFYRVIESETIGNAN